MKIPIAKQKAFIAEFEKVRPDYVEYAALLHEILTKVVSNSGFLAIVQARAKTIPSFSTKIISKDKYKNPLVDMTDLCGGRVILHFHSHVEEICAFIKENFEIDEANSLDLRSKLKVSEFGYRSVHYIITPKKDRILGIPIAEKFKSMKAEVQVRTLTEHVWADISHDRIYKTNLTIPEDWKREAARLSAILENADATFAKMSSDIDSVSLVYELQFENAKVKTEIEKLNTLIAVQHTDANACVKNLLNLAAIYRAMDDYGEIIHVLKSWLDKAPEDPVLLGKLWFEYGIVSVLSSADDTNTDAYADGMEAIKKSLDILSKLPDDVRHNQQQQLSYVYYRYGRVLQRYEEESGQLDEHFRLAYDMMPDNQLYFVALMESLVLRNIDMAKYNITLFKANILKAIPEIEQLIDMGIKRVPAWFAIGHCYLMLDDEAGCIRAYSHAVETLLNSKYLTSHSTVAAEIRLIGKFRILNPSLVEQIKLYLNIAMFLVADEPDKKRYGNYLKRHQIRKKPFKTPAIIVAGGASLMEASKTGEYREYISEIMHDFKGTLISGGTTAGIPGLVGEVKAEKEKLKPVDFDLLAYLPKNLPPDAVKSTAYDTFNETDLDKFSALDIFSYWADLISNGINPAEVILFGINGGKISMMEYQIALSLGAKVALLTFSGRAVSDFLKNTTWKNHPNLIQLPADPLTAWALVNISPETLLSKKDIETLAPEVHEFYRQKELDGFKSNSEDVNRYKVLMMWDNLSPALQNSNLSQVAFYETMLKRVNLGIRKADKPKLFDIEKNLTKEDYDFLAMLEHARWNAERLINGWRCGPKKDISAKINPCITAWDNLDDEIKSYDYEPVKNIPSMLAKIGYEVFEQS
jgi:ppGpp synthetase/RelA/SpoT-type nucleotidyltranferase